MPKNKKREWRTLSVVVTVRATGEYLEKDLRWGVENALRECFPRWVPVHERKNLGTFRVAGIGAHKRGVKRRHPKNEDVDAIRVALKDIGTRLSRLETLLVEEKAT